MRLAIVAAFGVWLAGCQSVYVGTLAPPIAAAAEAGQVAAELDAQTGYLTLRTYGLATAWQSVYGRLLSERLGVRLEVVGGCLVDAQVVTETAAYNRVMRREIAKRFGPHALEEIEEDAMRVVSATDQAAGTARLQ